MSAELFDGESAGALALPAVDILPAKPSRKSKAPADAGQAPEPLLEASPLGWAEPAPHVQAQTNPWTGAPLDPSSASVPPPADAPGVQQTAVWAAVPVPTDLSAPPPAAPAATAPDPMQAPMDPVDADAAPKKFFGMTVRRPKKAAAAPEAGLDPVPGPVDVLAAPTTPAPEAAYQAVVAPVAAWPTDVGMSVVADAEPQQGAGSHAAPAANAAIQLPTAEPADAAPMQAPVLAPVDGGPVAVPAAAVAAPVLQAPVVAPVDSAELDSLRAQLAVSESQRLAAEQRADQAVGYAQQTQARLGQLEAEGQSRLAAAETRARAAANEAQDWQIRHREAEATIAELAQSVAGAEKRMAELRAERDDLAAELDVATAPDQHAPTT